MGPLLFRSTFFSVTYILLLLLILGGRGKYGFEIIEIDYDWRQTLRVVLTDHILEVME